MIDILSLRAWKHGNWVAPVVLIKAFWGTTSAWHALLEHAHCGRGVVAVVEIWVELIGRLALAVDEQVEGLAILVSIQYSDFKWDQRMV